MSLSNVIKSFSYKAIDDIKVVEVAHKLPISPVSAESDDPADSEAELPADLQAKFAEMGEQIVRDAEAYAEEQVRLAGEEAARLKEQAGQEIEAWWNDRRALDEQQVEEQRQAGFEQGYRDGLVQAEEAMRAEFADKLDEARTVLEQAHMLKEQIIQEAEPFLVELSCAIAGKIVDRQLSAAPDWTAEMVRKVLARRRENGLITLCVAPEQFAYMQDMKDELATAIDSQAELQILPDAQVRDKGCIVRSSFGSIDARIDTQLVEIKNALLQVAYASNDNQGES